MRTVRVEWIPAEGRFTALGSHADQVLSINAPQEGRRAPTGFSASELLLAGIGSCSAWDVVEILRKGRHHATAVEVRVTGEQSADPPWAYGRIELRYLVRGRGIPHAFLERAVRLSVERYCSVIATVRGVAEVVHSVQLVEEAADPA